MNFKDIHIGTLIRQKITDSQIDIVRVCNFFSLSEPEIESMLNSESLESKIILKWCKLLEYDFFRIYSQHLILYSPPTSGSHLVKKRKLKSSLPSFRKNIYTKEIIDFILNRINSGELSKIQVIERYGIPKTTLYKWINKYETLNK
ncbi:transposase [Chryseobacterium gambrini]|uniref:Transposase n=3 Tax=Chryseobacterium group TaxID=2782232 RepID=A0AAJ1R486_9FLAO|nr:transposase [Chryseobacterium gambrini]MCF2218411.1 transposase [Chryseobacterium sp. PS-8]MDN4013680.1 transposase [Chryseobacterium gambrini]MDN4028045.1 transposase [Chryseobacterium gambrini]QWA39762.1 transposase [Chryseobacterium sp. ZHDP1]